MELTGFIESLELSQLRGWAQDTTQPDHHVSIEVMLGEKCIAECLAALYRVDLHEAGIAGGDHAFVVNLKRKLKQSDLRRITIFAIASSGVRYELPRLNQTLNENKTLTDQIVFQDVHTDSDHYPVFILGAARSGTSALNDGLLKIGKFSGHQEGHIFDLLTPLHEIVNKFYLEKSNAGMTSQNSAVAKIPVTYFESALWNMFIELANNLYPSKLWIDKTPNTNMITLAPLLKRIWPNSRFIFMKRRAFENITSRTVKFSTDSFSEHCQAWSGAFISWASVKQELAGAAVEIDQKLLEQRPVDVASALKNFLSLTDEETSILEKAFELDHPERTSIIGSKPKSLAQMRWTDDQQNIFNEYCFQIMTDFGYALNNRYFAKGREDEALVWV